MLTSVYAGGIEGVGYLPAETFEAFGLCFAVALDESHQLVVVVGGSGSGN